MPPNARPTSWQNLKPGMRRSVSPCITNSTFARPRLNGSSDSVWAYAIDKMSHGPTTVATGDELGCHPQVFSCAPTHRHLPEREREGLVERHGLAACHWQATSIPFTSSIRSVISVLSTHRMIRIGSTRTMTGPAAQPPPPLQAFLFQFVCGASSSSGGRFLFF